MIVVDTRQENPIRASDGVTSEPIKPQDPVTRTVFGLSPGTPSSFQRSYLALTRSTQLSIELFS